jgi:hypothetical protein
MTACESPAFEAMIRGARERLSARPGSSPCRFVHPASVEWMRRSPTTSVSPLPRARLIRSLLSAPR